MTTLRYLRILLGAIWVAGVALPAIARQDTKYLFMQPDLTSTPPIGGSEAPFTIVRVFFGTDRAPSRKPHTEASYTGERAKGVSLGWSTVSIPKDHRLGDWEKPTIFTVTPKQTKHVLLLNTTSLAEQEFVRRLRDRVQKSTKKEALIFVHGFNVTFSDAIQRTATLAYDLKFDGAAIAFSWPSRGDLHAYMPDEASVEFAIPDLEDFIALVASASGATHVHLIAHSMGNRALLRALANLQSEQRSPTNLAQVVLTAPDVDRDVFAQLISSVTAIAQRVTLYGSTKDKALLASRVAHGGPRAGEGGSRLFVAAGIDSVDASAVDTGLVAHSYYGDNISVITDLVDLIRATVPRDRVCLSPHRRQALLYWVFDRCRKP